MEPRREPHFNQQQRQNRPPLGCLDRRAPPSLQGSQELAQSGNVQSHRRPRGDVGDRRSECRDFTNVASVFPDAQIMYGPKPITEAIKAHDPYAAFGLSEGEAADVAVFA